MHTHEIRHDVPDRPRRRERPSGNAAARVDEPPVQRTGLRAWQPRRFVTRRIGNEADAADIAQQAFIEASNAYGDFRGDSKLSTWLYGIALNLVRNYLSRAPSSATTSSVRPRSRITPACNRIRNRSPRSAKS